jgi:hypothetical protein
MKRRRGLGLLVALALLVAPAAATVAASPSGAAGRSTIRITAHERHAAVVHAVTASSRGRDRRGPHHPTSSVALFAAMAGVAPAATWSGADASATSSARSLSRSARPRAPPAVV